MRHAPTWKHTCICALFSWFVLYIRQGQSDAGTCQACRATLWTTPSSLLHASHPVSISLTVHWICAGTKRERSRAPRPTLFAAGPPEGGCLSNLATRSRRLKIPRTRARLKSPQHEQRLLQLLCMPFERAWLYILISFLMLLDGLHRR